GRDRFLELRAWATISTGRVAVSVLDRLFTLKFALLRSTSSSTTSDPMLWRVPTHFGRGLPRPTTRTGESFTHPSQPRRVPRSNGGVRGVVGASTSMRKGR